MSYNWPENSMLESAWGIIANAGGGNWESQTPEWQEAAKKWREAYHRTLRQLVHQPDSPQESAALRQPVQTGAEVCALPSCGLSREAMCHSPRMNGYHAFVAQPDSPNTNTGGNSE